MHLDRTLWQRECVPRNLLSSPQAERRERYHEESQTGNQGSAPSPRSLFPIIRSHLKFPEPSKSTTSWRTRSSKYESVKNISYSNHGSTHADITLLLFFGLLIWLGRTLKIIAEGNVWCETLLSEWFQLGLKHAFPITENKTSFRC